MAYRWTAMMYVGWRAPVLVHHFHTRGARCGTGLSGHKIYYLTKPMNTFLDQECSRRTEEMKLQRGTERHI